MLETFFYIIKCFTHWKIPSLTPFILITISCFDSYIHSVQNYLLLSKYPYTYPSFKPSMNMSSYFWTCYLEEIYMWDSGNWDRPKGIPWMRRWHVYVLYTFWGQKDYLLSHLLKAHEVSSLHFFCYFSLCKLLLLAKNSSVNHEPGKESYTMFPGKKDLKKSKSSSVENAKVEILPIRKTLGIVLLLSQFGTSMFSRSDTNCCFLTCIQISQEADKVIWYFLSWKIFHSLLWSTQSMALA